MISYSALTVTARVGVSHSSTLCPALWKPAEKTFRIAKPWGNADLPVASVLDKVIGYSITVLCCLWKTPVQSIRQICFFIETYNDSIIFDSCSCCKVEWGILQNTWKLVFVEVGGRSGIFSLCLFSLKSLYKDPSCSLSFQVLCCGKLMASSPKLSSKMLLTLCKLQLYLELGFLVTCLCSACLPISNRWWSLNLKYELLKKQSKVLVFHVNFAEC